LFETVQSLSRLALNSDMAVRRTRAENLALTLLARDGIAAIWLTHLAAAQVFRQGHKAAAVAIIEIAEAAEREWLRQGNTPVLIGDWQ
jgi:hypothetical protein